MGTALSGRCLWCPQLRTVPPPRVSGPQRLCWYFPACLSSPVDPFYSLAPLASFLQLWPPRSLFLVVADLPCLPLDSWILSCPHGSHRAALVVTFTRGTHLTGEGALNIVVP